MLLVGKEKRTFPFLFPFATAVFPASTGWRFRARWRAANVATQHLSPCRRCFRITGPQRSTCAQQQWHSVVASPPSNAHSPFCKQRPASLPLLLNTSEQQSASVPPQAAYHGVSCFLALSDPANGQGFAEVLPEAHHPGLGAASQVSTGKNGASRFVYRQGRGHSFLDGAEADGR